MDSNYMSNMDGRVSDSESEELDCSPDSSCVLPEIAVTSLPWASVFLYVKLTRSD